jgi:hypothetical protein
MATGHMHAEVMARATRDVLECWRVCEETVSYCLHRGGRHVEAEHLKLMIDCAEICGACGGIHAARVAVHGRAFPYLRGGVPGVCGGLCPVRRGRADDAVRGGVPPMRGLVRRDGRCGRLTRSE